MTMLDKGDDHIMLKPLANFFEQANATELGEESEIDDLLAAVKNLVSNKK
jgi:hypothetical protein